MISNNKNNIISKYIIVFMYLPLTLSLFFITQLDFKIAYFIYVAQFIIFLYSIKYIRYNLTKRQIVFGSLFLILFLISLFSGFFSTSKIEVIRLSLIIYGINILFVLMIFNDNQPNITFKKIANIQMIIGSAFSLFAIFLLIFGVPNIIVGKTVQSISIGPLQIHQVINGKLPFYRVASLQTNPNSLGMTLMISQIFTLFLFTIKEISKKKFLVLYFLQIVALIFTQSRSAIITTFIMLVIFIILNFRNDVYSFKIVRSKISPVHVTGLSISSLLIGYYLIFISNSGVFSRFSKGLSSRNLPWEIIVEKVKENALIGVGFGVSADVLLNNVGIKAHNVFLNVIAEIGLIGLIIFLAIWMLGIVFSYKNLKQKDKTRNDKLIYIVIISILASLIFHQMFENKLLVYDFYMFLWIYLISYSTL